MDRIIPVVTLQNAEDRTKVLNALKKEGILCAEICFRTACAAEAIRLAVQEYPDMNIGAGTVINKAQCETALDLGAKFIVSPGLSEEVALVCRERGVPYYPGCVTPTEITAAIDMGLDLIKFFPAGIYGGLAALKALSAPFGGVEFIPTGGVGQADLADYLRAPFVAAVGGSWLCTRRDIAGRDFEKIGTLCREAAETVRAVRG